VNLIGTSQEPAHPGEEAARLLAERPPHPGLRPRPDLPDDTRLWAALQAVSGGPWAGSVYDVDPLSLPIFSSTVSFDISRSTCLPNTCATDFISCSRAA
jgi:hypothetical protein